MEIIRFLNKNILWGVPMLVLMTLTGLYLTFATKGFIFKNFSIVLKSTLFSLFKKNPKAKDGALSPFAAVSTALAATVGTGNIIGVAIAIRTGGPGAIFWMWVSALLGMVIKYSEVTLSVFYREKNSEKEYVGGPMYYITKGLGFKCLSFLFCCFAILSSFGIGNMVQSNSLSSGLSLAFGMENWVSGIVISVLCGAVLLGGIKRISSVAEILVPFMALGYMVSAIIILVLNYDKIPTAFSSIVTSAFSKSAPVGGFLGAGIMYSVRIGVARGLFTNEAGLGSAPIAHASADVDHPSKQGMWGAFEVFFDTIVMCTITALVVISTDVWKAPIGFPDELLVNTAFSSTLPSSEIVVTLGLILFSFATIIAWYYYGEKCVEYIFGTKASSLYRVLYVSATFFGAVSDISSIWEVSDTLNALMALPNLIALIFLAPEIKKITDDFLKNHI